ncbi:ATP-binding protein [Paenibacillus sp.]|uniref:ATP-binding protein n=1 Tax=Paenibacillus sp. TaxID=58172 RepID=UPI0028AE755C|nr:ATP-binding protein [Paenibacillus sp.]
MRVNVNLKEVTVYTWKVGIYQGIVGIILLYAGHQFNNLYIVDLRTITILISAYIGGPFASVITAFIIVLFWISYDPSMLIIIQGTALVSLILITSNISVRLLKHYWIQWMVSVTASNLLLILYNEFMEIPLSLSASWKFLLIYQASGMFIAAKLYYMYNVQKLKQRFDELQCDLLEILHLQPGFIYKLTKESGKIKYKIVGGSLCSELGISYSDIAGKTIDQVTIFPEELSHFMQYQKEKAWEGEHLSFEILLEEHTLLITLKPVLYNQIVGSVIGSVIDISQRKQSEKQLKESEELYRSLVESSQDFIVRLDVQGRITSVNKQVAETFHISTENLIGTRLTDLIPPGEYVEKWLYYFNQVISRRTMESFEYSFSSARREHEYDITLSPFYNMNQEVIGITCTAHDISHIKKSRAADEANKAKSDFLARISHEIRTPISGIIGLTDLLSRQEMSPVQKDYLDKILSSSHTLLGIINDVLDFSKIEAGKIELQKVNFNLHQLMQELSDILAALVGQKQLKFIIDTSADIPGILNGDSLRIEQILINMINNAIKFTDSGHIYVKAEPVRYEEDIIHIEFSVEDTGIGLTSDQINHLFEPFMQVRHYSRQKSEGTGLGLPICQYFVELMGGNIEISSQPGRGSKFTFTIPFEYALSDDLLQRDEQIQFSQTKVLVIESNATVRNGLCSMLESMNFHVLACGKLEMDPSRIPVEVILADLSMDDGEGLKDWLHLQETVFAHPVRFVAIATASVRDEIMKLPKNLHPDTIIVMPVSRNGLYQAMRSLFWKEADSVSNVHGREVYSLPEYKRRILLAEDNEINQIVVTELLKLYGFQVSVANDGNEVLCLLDKGQWDLLLLDIHMPELDGVEVTKKIRQNQKYDQLLIIALTANTVKEEHAMYYRVGMNGVLTKPLQVDYLISLLNRWQTLVEYNASFGNRQQRESGTFQLKEIDFQVILQRVGGKEHIMRHMFIMFLRDYSHFAEQLREALIHNDFSRALRMLHTIKGVAGNICADRLLVAAEKLEIVLEQGADVQTEMDNLELELQWISSSLQYFLDNEFNGDSANAYYRERIILQ